MKERAEVLRQDINRRIRFLYGEIAEIQRRMGEEKGEVGFYP